MAHIVTDRILETTTTTGTGAYALGGAVAQFQDFDSQMANADTTVYFSKGISGTALTNNEWEVGLGTWNTGNTLTRTTVVRSSNSNAAVNYSAGTKLIGMTFTPTVRQPSMAFTGPLTPATSGLTDLGTTALPWRALYLAAGNTVDWGNGAVTLNGTGDVLALNGGGFANAFVGTATQPPMSLVAGTLNTTPGAGAVEMDATNFYGTTDAGNRGHIPVVHIIRANATRTYTSNVSAQNVFDAPTNGRITLETGTYRFRGTFSFGSMSATSGNRNLNLLGGGSATAANWLWHAWGMDGATGGAVATGSTHMTSSTSPASIVTATISPTLIVSIDGSVEISAGGTFQPQTTMVTAAASTMTIGSYFEIWRVGTDALVSTGQWD